jgi:polysaccharide export outer membrane protein
MICPQRLRADLAAQAHPRPTAKHNLNDAVAIGVIPAGGLTLEQVQANVENKLKAGRYITDPRASVAVFTYRSFYILGEVASPGAYPYVSGMKVLVPWRLPMGTLTVRIRTM